MQKSLKTKDEQITRIRSLFMEMAQIANYVAGSRSEIQSRVQSRCLQFQEAIQGKPSAEEFERNLKIRDAEINFEVLRLGGELQEAKIEIKRLRDKLLLSETTQLTSPKTPPKQEPRQEAEEQK